MLLISLVRHGTASLRFHPLEHALRRCRSEKRRRAMRRAIPTRWGNVIPFLIASVAIGWCLQNAETPAAEITAATTPSESAAYLVGFLPPNYPNTPPSRNRPPTGRNDTRPPRPP